MGHVIGSSGMDYVIVIGEGHIPNMMIARLVEALPDGTYIMGRVGKHRGRTVDASAVKIARRPSSAKNGGYLDFDKLNKDNARLRRAFVFVENEGQKVPGLDALWRFPGLHITVIERSGKVLFDDISDKMLDALNGVADVYKAVAYKTAPFHPCAFCVDASCSGLCPFDS